MILDDHRLKLIIQPLAEDIRDSVENLFERLKEVDILELEIASIRDEIASIVEDYDADDAENLRTVNKRLEEEKKVLQEINEKLKSSKSGAATPPSTDKREYISKYVGICRIRNCGGPIAVGEKIMWSKAGGAEHMPGECHKI